MTSAEKYLGFKDTWLIVVAIPFITFITSLMIFGTEYLFDNFIKSLLTCSAFTMSYYMAVRQMLIQYHKRFPTYTFDTRRLGFVMFWLIVIYFGIQMALSPIVKVVSPECVAIVHENKVAETISTGLLIMLMFFLYEGIYYFNKSRLIEIEKNKLEKATAVQRLETLKNQVNPHFLFNSLNTLVTMIPDEPKLAIEFVQQLSKSYRGILEVRDEKLITIEKELKSLESYIYLLKTRFQGKIHIYNDLRKDILQHFILPLSLQILIENAVKHNVTSTSQPLKIQIFEENNFIVVKNNLQKKDQLYNSTKLGLANIKSRYKLLANREIEVEESTKFFIVKLPIIKHT